MSASNVSNYVLLMIIFLWNVYDEWTNNIFEEAY